MRGATNFTLMTSDLYGFSIRIHDMATDMTSAKETGAPRESYDPIAKILHWLIAAMVVLQFVLANLAENAEDAGSKFQQLVLLANHKSVGITILSLAIVRLAWRFVRPPPAPLPMPIWQSRAASISHWSMYALIILIPLSGWLLSSAAAVSVSWFNFFQLPDLVTASEGLEESFEETHEILANLLGVLALIHVSAATKHTFINRDGAIRRISSTLAFSLFVIVIVLGVLGLTRVGRASETSMDRLFEAVSSGQQREAVWLPPWQIDYSNSYIRFVAEQAGATFESEWKDWQATLYFDEAHLDVSSFDVTISTSSVETRDKERNETLMDREWFDGDNFPQISYQAATFSPLPGGKFSASGEIHIKDVTAPVELTFSVRRDGDRLTLQGNATLDRLALGVGTGEWEDTTWVGQFVEVEVHVEGRIDK